MLNVRKLKQDFSQNVLREGKDLFTESDKVTSAKIVSLDSSSHYVSAQKLLVNLKMAMNVR